MLHENAIGTILMKSFIQIDEHIEILFKRRDQEYLAEKIKKEFMTIIEERLKSVPNIFDMTAILVEYQTSAVIGVIKYWYQHSRSISEEEILEKIYDLTSNGFLNTLKRAVKQTIKRLPLSLILSISFTAVISFIFSYPMIILLQEPPLL